MIVMKTNIEKRLHIKSLLQNVLTSHKSPILAAFNREMRARLKF